MNCVGFQFSELRTVSNNHQIDIKYQPNITFAKSSHQLKTGTTSLTTPRSHLSNDLNSVSVLFSQDILIHLQPLSNSSIFALYRKFEECRFSLAVPVRRQLYWIMS